MRALAKDIGYSAELIESTDEESTGVYGADWMILTPGPAPKDKLLAWTDDFASIWRIWQ